ncbi:kinase A anchor protein [Lipomyces oligophaga]|uniref:kinase A anchor protein n=1 Tax=Lipomyces oligophaga TaxID=45792 RepID=UPI0034CE3A8D
MSGKSGSRLTHFFSLRIPQSSSLTGSVVSLHEEIMREFKDIPSEALLPSSSYHLTLAVCSLTNSQLVEKAINGLYELRLRFEEEHDSIWPNAPLVVSLRGLDVWRSYGRRIPDATGIMFAKVVDESGDGAIQTFADAVKNYFINLGLVILDERTSRPVSLHATVIKMARKISSRSKDSRSRYVNSKFDPRPLIQKFECRQLLSTTRLPVLELCRMGIRPDGTYECVASIDLP